MKEKIPFYNEKEFNEMMKKTKKGTFSGWYIINPENKSVEFSGNFNRQFKLNKPVIPVNTEYVTRKEFNEYKDSNDQRLIKIETTLAAQGEQIRIQGEQIRELQVEQKAQRQEFNARMDRLENLLVESIESTNKRFDSIEGRLDSMDSRLDSMENRLDSIEGCLDSVEGRLDSMENRLDSMETRLDKIDPPK
ncbi:DUF16 domain-containing protein [Mycoplasmoides pneumoniae]|uniref:DUF16 family-like protein n=3 Tax=Mycoplasmoides pneumoniae TaxID=2104 RepID=B2BDZ3_MYCPM|nr:DUF16 domain-containing protein [Mycoplasmoides pneumoniae]ABR53875.1 MPN138/MPN137 fusion protein [Mycoplasmoides pneumoniae]ADK86908.1 conserved hypothetical protein [Mycoplasmoides pneumoniae FH]ALA30984.1 hypothetical protein B434_02320 [Mycoplasmoides pneumoniae 19294]ALA31421.1 hypothetical protein F536_00795 [Mycoplasmoides pneumoniae 39443]ALA35654.1 hypothetical protein F539_00800 [Mycoplasmoides pneumoniae FH]